MNLSKTQKDEKSQNSYYRCWCSLWGDWYILKKWIFLPFLDFFYNIGKFLYSFGKYRLLQMEWVDLNFYQNGMCLHYFVRIVNKPPTFNPLWTVEDLWAGFEISIQRWLYQYISCYSKTISSSNTLNIDQGLFYHNTLVSRTTSHVKNGNGVKSVTMWRWNPFHEKSISRRAGALQKMVWL